MLNDNVKQIVNNVLNKECYYNKEYECYETDIYVDYRDTLNNEDIKEILKDDTEDTFFQKINEYYIGAEQDLIDCINDKCCNLLDKEKIDFDESDVLDYISQNLIINYPYDHFKNQKLNVNLTIDTGDKNYEFTLNGDCGELQDIDDKSSLLWLCKTQGYDKSQLEKAFSEDTESKFLNSVVDEIENETTSMNTLTFFLKTTLGELMELKSKKRFNIFIDKNTNVGLVDYYNGAGGILDICLEQSLIINNNIINNIEVDGLNNGYSVTSIYGISEDFWNTDLKIVSEF